MRTKANLIKDKLYVIELKDNLITRLIVTHEDFSLSYELLTIYNEDLNSKFNLKEYINSLNYENLFSYLQEVNEDDYDDCLYHEKLIDDLIVKDEEDEKN